MLRRAFGPDSVTSIGRHALAACTKLKSVTVPNRFRGYKDMGFKDIFGDDYEQIKFTFI